MYGTAPVSTERAQKMRDASTRPEGAVGTSGKPLSGGRVSGYEHNRRLLGPQLTMEAYRKAERNPAVAAGWGVMRSLALSARWDVSAANDSPTAQAAAEHVRRNLGIGRARSPLGRSWERLLAEFLQPQLRGFGWWELTCREVGGVWYTLPLWRDPGSVYQWVTDADEQLVGIVQQANWLSTAAEVPVSRVLYMARDAEGTNFEGVGLLRSIEPLTRDQTETLQSMMAAVKRWALGTPDAVLDRRAFMEAHPGATDEDFKAEATRWDGILAKYMSFERNRFVRESWVTLGKFGGDLSTQPGFDAAINLQNRLILTAFLAQFLQLGASGSGGSYSLGQVQADVAVQAAENMLEATRDELNTSLIPRMVRWGVGDVGEDDLPTLTFSGLRAPLWVQHLEKLPSLFSSLATPQTAVEDELLRELGFGADAVDRSPAERLRGIAGRPPGGTVPPGPTVIRSTP